MIFDFGKRLLCGLLCVLAMANLGTATCLHVDRSTDVPLSVLAPARAACSAVGSGRCAPRDAAGLAEREQPTTECDGCCADASPKIPLRSAGLLAKNVSRGGTAFATFTWLSAKTPTWPRVGSAAIRHGLATPALTAILVAHRSVFLRL